MLVVGLALAFLTGDPAKLDDSSDDESVEENKGKDKEVDTSKDDESVKENKGKGKEVDTSKEDKSGKEPEVETFESKYKGTYMAQAMLKAYEAMAKHEQQWLEEEESNYILSGSTYENRYLPENNYHDKVYEFRAVDEKIMAGLRAQVESVRLEDNPEDAGSSKNKRDYTEEDFSDNKKIKDNTSDDSIKKDKDNTSDDSKKKR